jgi:hypothetical protein
LLPAELVDVHHRAQLFHARQNGKLFRLDVADAGRPQHRNHVRGDLAPVPFDLLLDVDFVDRQPLVDGVGIAGLRMKETHLEIERVRQAVGRIDAHHQGPIPETRELQARSGSQTGLPDAPFAAEEQDAHTSFLHVPQSPSSRSSRQK